MKTTTTHHPNSPQPTDLYCRHCEQPLGITLACHPSDILAEIGDDLSADAVAADLADLPDHCPACRAAIHGLTSDTILRDDLARILDQRQAEWQALQAQAHAATP